MTSFPNLAQTPGIDETYYAETPETHKQNRCSVTWFNHVQFTGGTSFQRSLGDLLAATGVAANLNVPNSSNLSDSNEDDAVVLHDVPFFTQAYAFGTDSSDVAAKLDATITEPILRNIDAGNGGAYLVSHHIATPGFLMIERKLTQFKKDLASRGCVLLVTALARDPVGHRTSEYLKFHADVALTSDLSEVLLKEPNFPIADGSRPFEQLREFLFMDEFGSAPAQLETADGAAMAGDDAKVAVEAFQLIEDVTATAERRANAKAPHATVAGVLRHEVKNQGEEGGASDLDETPLLGGGDLSVRFDAALETVTRVAQRLITKFDVALLRTDTQLSGLRRLARVMDWHPELLDGDTRAAEKVRESVGDALNTHDAFDSAAGPKVSVVTSKLPDKHRRELQRWTELDAALYLVAVAQEKAHEAKVGRVENSNQNSKETTEPVDVRLGLSEMNAALNCETRSDRVLEDAFQLARRSRSEHEKAVGLGGMVARVEQSGGCFAAVLVETAGLAVDDVPRAVIDAEEGVGPVDDAEANTSLETLLPLDDAKDTTVSVTKDATVSVPEPPRPAKAVLPDVPEPVTQPERNEVYAMLKQIQSDDEPSGVDGFPDASDLPIVTEGTRDGDDSSVLGARKTRVMKKFGDEKNGGHHLGTAERAVENALGFDLHSADTSSSAALGRKTVTGKHRGTAERMVERAIGFQV
jgi:hypothetical protein